MSTKTFAVLMTGLLVALTGLCAPVFGPIPVANPSFETPPVGGFPNSCGGNCVFSNAAIPGWTDVGQLQPGGPDGLPNSLFNFLPDGPTVAFNNSGTISQTVDVMVQAGVTYELMVDLGHRNDTAFTASADLLVGGQTIAATGTTPGPGDWSTYTAIFHPPAADDGQTIPFTIQLISSGVQGNFDDVRLAAVPEPVTIVLTGAGLLGLGLFRRRRRN